MKWLFLLLLAGCTLSSPLWRIDTLSTGDASFDIARLRYTSPQNAPPLTFELLRMGEEVAAYLSLTRFRFTPTEEGLLNVRLRIDQQSWDELVPLHEGKMRVRLSPETTQRLILALQEGKEVGILVDDFEETLDPRQFAPSLNQFLGNGSFLQRILRGPLP